MLYLTFTMQQTPLFLYTMYRLEQGCKTYSKIVLEEDILCEDITSGKVKVTYMNSI